MAAISSALGACATSGPTAEQVTRPPVAPVVSSTPVQTNARALAKSTRPRDLQIAQLAADPRRVVRIRGMVSRLGQLGMVPPRTVFRLRDRTGGVTVVLGERRVLSEGTRLELVGRYMEIPSPAHVDTEDPPTEPCFVVERYLTLVD